VFKAVSDGGLRGFFAAKEARKGFVRFVKFVV